MVKIYLCLHGSRLGGFGTWAECKYLQRGMLGKVWGRRALVDCIAVRLLVAGEREHLLLFQTANDSPQLELYVITTISLILLPNWMQA